jgi:hypothetical protein
MILTSTARETPLRGLFNEAGPQKPGRFASRACHDVQSDGLLRLVNLNDDATETIHSDPFRAEDWVTASETLRLVMTATLSRTANIDIATRAHAGMLRARAELFIVGDNARSPEGDIPRAFWWAEGHEALKQNWEIGDFETWIDKRVRYQVFGVKFHRGDLRKMVPGAFEPQPEPSAPARDTGGRPMSPLWPEWVAELTALVHDEGVPQGSGAGGADALIARVADRLAARGLEGPSRSTLQETARAVLRRLRDAEN